MFQQVGREAHPTAPEGGRAPRDRARKARHSKIRPLPRNHTTCRRNSFRVPGYEISTPSSPAQNPPPCPRWSIPPQAHRTNRRHPRNAPWPRAFERGLTAGGRKNLGGRCSVSAGVFIHPPTARWRLKLGTTRRSSLQLLFAGGRGGCFLSSRSARVGSAVRMALRLILWR